MVIIFIACLLFAIVEERYQFSKYIPIVILFIIFCFTKDNYDYYYYLRGYERAARGILGTINNGTYFLTLIMIIFSKLGLDFFRFRMVLTLIEFSMIYSTLKRYLRSQTLFWTALIIFPGWWMSTLLRHTLALSIMIFGIRYLVEEKKTNSIKFIICVFFAGLIHSSFWVYLVLILVKFLDKRKTLIAVLSISLLLVLARNLGFINSLISLFPIEDDINSRLTSANISLKSMVLNSIYTLAISSIGLISHVLMSGKIKLKSRKETGLNDYGGNNIIYQFEKIIIPVNICSIVIIGLSLYSSVCFRLYHFFAIFNLIAYSLCEQKYRGNTINRMTLQLIIIVYLIAISILFCYFTPTLKTNIIDYIINNNSIICW